MSFNFLNLDSATRELMKSEVEKDIKNQTLYKSKRFTTAGENAYPDLIKEAVTGGTEISLVESLRQPSFLKETEESTSSKGLPIIKGTPVTSIETFAEGQFNNFYMRALCIRAKDEGKILEIYRAKQVNSSRPESDAKIGQYINPENFLNELMANDFKFQVTGWSGGPNSGLSVKLV